MAPRSSNQPQDYFEAKASYADEQAATAPNSRLAERWRRIAETYRWIAYRQRAFGKWQPPAAPLISNDRKGRQLLK